MRELGLWVRDFTGLDRWRWELTGPDGRVLARHEVRLDREAPQFEAFLDLPGYVRRNAAPDQRVAREREIVREVGAWAGERILGPAAELLADAAPAVLRVVVPADVPRARRLLYVPLELARLRGRPLTAWGLTPVTQIGDARPGERDVPAAGRPVRMLALFSLPEGSRALNLRRERRALTRLCDRAGRAVELHTLQYGVTRDRLRALLERPEGWDVVHVSAHGTPGELLLETDTGRADRVVAPDLARLLAGARGVRLVTLAACWSGALAAREQRRALGVPAAADDAFDGGAAGPGPEAVGALAGALVERLDCAVLAMRHPVADPFAIALAESLYGLLLDGRVLPEALTEAVTAASDTAGPAFQAATPALFGARAAGLRLVRGPGPRGDAAARQGPRGGAVPGDGPREGAVSGDGPREGAVSGDGPREGAVSGDGPREGAVSGDGPREGAVLVAGGGGAPGVAERFVGRGGVMARASAALAPRSGLCGVLLLGMPGAGKTACARELAATHAHAFDAVVWCRVPEEAEPGSLLADLALALDRAVPEPGCVPLLDDPTTFGEFVAAVAGRLDRRRLLVVVDRVDGLLAPGGGWRDGRWGRLLAGLTARAGAGRLVVTGGVRPPDAGPLLRTEPVDLLGPDETVLLARELPRLAALADGRLPGVPASTGRRYVTALLDVTRGHPELLELADGQAADPARLTALLGAAGPPEGFFTAGRPGDGTGGDGRDFLRVLRAWADGIADGLPPAHRDLFHFLCRLEEDDRTRAVVDHTWPELRNRLGHPEEPAGAGTAALAACGLVTPRRPDAGAAAESYDIQSAVAAEGRRRAGEEFRRLVDELMAGYWVRVFGLAWDREGTGAEGARLAGPVLARAGLAAAPYLLRTRRWEGAEALLHAVLRRDGTRATRARVLPVLRRAAALAAAHGGARPSSGALAEVLWATDPATAERQARAELAAALAAGDHTVAAQAAGSLAGLSLRAGRLDEALAFASTETEHARRSPLGPWTRLLAEVHRLHVRVERAEPEAVLAEAPGLRRRMDALPRERRGPEAVLWWEVWEEFCDTVQRAAVHAERWETALEYNAELCASRTGRGAPGADLAQALFPSYLPLLRLGRAREALETLERCREVFEAADDPLHLGEVYGALATVEDARGRGALALARGRDCLRYAYRAGVPATVAVGHANFGGFLHAHARDAPGAVAHHLAGALLGVLTGGRTADTVRAVAHDLRVFGPVAADPPDDPAVLCARVGEVPGVALEGLLTRVAGDPGRVREALAGLVARARDLAAAEDQEEAGNGGGAGRAPVSAGAVEAVWALVWEPVLAGLVAAGRGNTAARVKVRQQLARHGALDPRFAALAGVLGRILDGERDGLVTAGLGPLDAPVAARALAALRREAAGGTVGEAAGGTEGEDEVPVALWPAMHLGPALGSLVAVATGHGDPGAVTRETLDGFRADPALAELAPVLAEILGGARDPALAERLRQPTQRAVVSAVLRCIKNMERDRR
ncbi:CHAT domain-containing protein OS=Streptomyces glaucescens OX=1907 GN=SGLAU_15050 PE=4 SV=1 [Streptomyces glaucescens]